MRETLLNLLFLCAVSRFAAVYGNGSGNACAFYFNGDTHD